MLETGIKRMISYVTDNADSRNDNGFGRLEITSFPGRRGFENLHIIRTFIHRPCRFFPEICHREKPLQPDDVSITHPRRPFVNTASNAAYAIP